MDGEYDIYDDLESILQDGSSEPWNLPLEYLRKITNNFADNQLLGKGGFGKVYKGVLQNGKFVAVKKLDQIQLGIQERQFENEVYHLMRLKHPNIVRFLGYCYETRKKCVEHNGKYIFAEMQQMLICLEYLPNGSLDRHLSDESAGHDWHTRYKIIKGICCGLHYLHEECQCQFSASIIHLDLKPANILLDDNMGPKVADFGLSRLFEDNKTQTCATSLSGSLGYMAPEYLIGRIVTTKADIYNLGVIIIEIITGSKVNIFSFSSPTSCQNFVERVLENWRNRLEGPTSETDCYEIKSCLEIGLGCIKFNREERPTIKEIIERLDRLESTNRYVNNEENPPSADQPDMTGTRASAGADNDDDDMGVSSSSIVCASRNWTLARGLFRRQLSRVMRFTTRLLSCLLMTRHRRRRRPLALDSLPETPNYYCGRPLALKDSLPETPKTCYPYCLPLASGDIFMETSSSFEHAAEKFTFAQLEAATKGFAPEAKIIGMGSSFGSVYRGNLPDGRQVAIKRAESGHRLQGRSAFRSEVSYLSRLRHRHLVGLVGYCDENEESLLLIYEYMENGALSDHLHPKAAAPVPAATPSPPSPVASSWKMRVKILLDASRGVEFLHDRPWIGHGNIKSSNILLDAGWTARVSDFGLSHAHLTGEDDVYGFGVVMLEVLTGKRATAVSEESDPDDGGSGSVSVVDYAVHSIVAGELGKVLDPRAPEPAAHEAEALGLVAYTALHCVLSLEGKGRPAMAAIVASLETALALCEGRSSILR